MLESLVSLDRSLFLSMNAAYNGFTDTVATLASNTWTWVPLYLLLLYLAWHKAGWRGMVWFLIGALLCVLLADQGSVHLFKDTVMRLRPSHDPQLAELVHLPTGRKGGLYGFVSSHAANTSAVALWAFYYLRRYGWLVPILIFWILVVAYARIMMGVHFPLDVICGMLFGFVVGCVPVVITRVMVSRGKLRMVG